MSDSFYSISPGGAVLGEPTFFVASLSMLRTKAGHAIHMAHHCVLVEKFRGDGDFVDRVHSDVGGQCFCRLCWHFVSE